MAPPSSTRRLPWSSGDGGAAGAAAGELSRPRNRWQTLVLHVRGKRRTNLEGLFAVRQIMEEEFMGMFSSFFGSMVQRVVSEEVQKAIFTQFNTPAAPPRLLVGWNQRPRYELLFQNDLKPVYTMTKLESSNGTAIKVAMVERLQNKQTSIVRFGPLSCIKVEVVVLHGSFNARNEESWTPEEFNKHIASGREKSAQLLTGNLTLKLNGGEGFLENATFTDNSSFTSTKKFRLGLRPVNASRERVLEGVTERFRVKERRVEGFEKHYPPMMDDEVWRLEKIGKNGPYFQALSDNGIDSVQKFLQAYMKDEQKLLKIFSKMPPSKWKSIIEHAMTCKPGDDLYLYEDMDIDAGLFFNRIYQLVGVKFDGCYKPIDQLDQVHKSLVESIKQKAYQNIDSLQSNYKMVNNYPVHMFPGPCTSLSSSILPNQQLLNHGQHNLYLGDTPTGQGFGSRYPRENLKTFLGDSNVPIDISRFVQGQTSNDAQLRDRPIINKVLPHNSSQGALLPGPRLTQLQIPNTEITHFGPDASPAVIPNNISVSQRAAQLDQYRQSDPAYSFEESYNSPSLNTLSSTEVVVALMQSQFQLPINNDSFSNYSDQRCNGEITIQPQQIATGFQPSRMNSFELSSYDELIQNFMSQISNNQGATTPLSPRNWVKIKAALKLSVGRLSRASRRGAHCRPTRSMLVQTK